MMVAVIIMVLGLMLALFFAATIAGGRAHDRANAAAARHAEAKRVAELPPGVSPWPVKPDRAL